MFVNWEKANVGIWGAINIEKLPTGNKRMGVLKGSRGCSLWVTVRSQEGIIINTERSIVLDEKRMEMGERAMTRAGRVNKDGIRSCAQRRWHIGM